MSKVLGETAEFPCDTLTYCEKTPLLGIERLLGDCPTLSYCENTPRHRRHSLIFSYC